MSDEWEINDKKSDPEPCGKYKADSQQATLSDSGDFSSQVLINQEIVSH